MLNGEWRELLQSVSDKRYKPDPSKKLVVRLSRIEPTTHLDVRYVVGSEVWPDHEHPPTSPAALRFRVDLYSLEGVPDVIGSVRSDSFEVGR